MLPHGHADLASPSAYWIPLVLGALCVFPLSWECRLPVRVGGPAGLGWPVGLRLARHEGWFGERLPVFLASLVVLPLFFWAFAAWKMWMPPFTDARLGGWPDSRR